MSDNQVIPDAAVVAALDAWGLSEPFHPRDIVSMRAALEAAAPHMLNT